MLNALNKYYNCLCKQENSPITPKGYSKVAVNFNMVLTKEGTLKAILPYTKKVATIVKGKMVEKEYSREEIFPFRNSSTKTVAETIDHREKYIFGMEFDKKDNKFVLSRKFFEACKEKTLGFFEGVGENSKIIQSYKLFLEKWKPDEQLENPILQEIAKNFIGAKFVISLDDEDGFLHNNAIVKELWEKNFEIDNAKSDVIGQCAISGKKGVEIAKLHNQVKGGSLAGTGFVSFNHNAFESYGKSKAQSYNSSVSKEVMENYTEAFNFLASSQNHKQIIDDMTLLFWAMTDKNEMPVIQKFCNIMGFQNTVEDQMNANINNANDSLKSLFDETVKGMSGDIAGFENYKNVKFYILGVKPNKSRLSVKLFLHDTFGKMIENLNKHHLDMQFDESDKQIPIWRIKEELKSPVAKKDLAPDLSTKILQSILTNRPYPRYLLDTAIYRVKTDQDNGQFKSVSRERVRIIRAVLIRLNKIKREEYEMLNKENKEEAYNCGRLFATLEMIQRKALGNNVNATIKDRFFASACSTPHLVFPRLIKLTQNHLGKIDKGLGVFYERALMEVMANLKDSFPKTLKMEKQGIFVLGYYQQKEAFYTKKTNNGEEE